MRAIYLALLVLLAAPAAAQTPAEMIEGRAVALDGGTLLLGDAKVRLFGLDAPEMRDWPLGARARAALDDLLGGDPVSCTVVDTDRLKRPVAVCTAAGIDLSAAMIARGQAVAYRVFTHGAAAPAGLAETYDAAEREARLAGLGIWAPEVSPAEAQGGSWTDWRFWQIVVTGALAFLGFTVGARIKHRYDLRFDRIREDKERVFLAHVIQAELVGLEMQAGNSRYELQRLRAEVDKPVVSADLVGLDLTSSSFAQQAGTRLGLLGHAATVDIFTALTFAAHFRRGMELVQRSDPTAEAPPDLLDKYIEELTYLIESCRKAATGLAEITGEAAWTGLAKPSAEPAAEPPP